MSATCFGFFIMPSSGYDLRRFLIYFDNISENKNKNPYGSQTEDDFTKKAATCRRYDF